MKGAVSFLILIVALIAIFVLGASVFIVQQTQQALVLRFGQPVAGRGLVSTPGLHFKIPFIENVVLLDKRILDLEMPQQEVLASDNTRIEVDAFLRYRIVDPLKFYQSVGTIPRGEIQLGFILNSAVRRVGVPDMSTTVLTTTLTGLASRSRLAGGTNPHARLGTTSVVSMFGGALVGAVLVLHAGATWSLGVAAGIVAVTAVFFSRTVPLEVSGP